MSDVDIEKFWDILEKYEDRLMRLSGMTGRGGARKGNLLGCGTYGCAYGYNDKVLKLTGDESEAIAAARLLRLGGHFNVYKIYGVYKLKSAGVFAIVQERLFKPSAGGEIDEIADLINETLIDDHMDVVYKELFYNYKGIDHFKDVIGGIILERGLERMEHEILQLLVGLEIVSESVVYQTDKSGRALYLKDDDEFNKILMYNLNTFDGNEYYDIFDQIASAVAWLYKNGIRFYDIHSGNVMQKDNDTPVLIDLGVSRVEGDYDIKLIERYIREVFGNGS